MSAQIDLRDVQGNILRGYKMDFVCHLAVRITNPLAARALLLATVSGDGGDGPRITTAVWDEKPAACLNVGVTATGLRALGLRPSSLATFPKEYLEGAAARAVKVGDVDESAPSRWVDGTGDPESVHLLWSVHARNQAALDEAVNRLEATWHTSRCFSVTTRFAGQNLPGQKVHFGYRDSISQPRFEVQPLLPGGPGEPPTYAKDPVVYGREDGQPKAPLGSVLLGYNTPFPGVTWQLPDPAELGVNGCYNAFRVIDQNVDAFEDFLRDSAKATGRPEEWIAAKLMGRYRDGRPLVWDTDPDEPFIDQSEMSRERFFELELNDFDYADSPGKNWDDHLGHLCPFGAHIRRCNPRSSRIVQRSANFTRRLVRRGIPYGKAYDPAHPNDGVKRGLLGNFMCASLIAQYEAIMYDWVNKGLQDPRITGTNDPIIGANHPFSSEFTIPLPDLDGKPQDPIELRGFPRFTNTVTCLYLFHPSITALRLLATLSGDGHPA